MPTPNYPYTIGTTAVTLLVDGRPFTFTQSEANGLAYQQIVDAIRNGDPADKVLALCDHFAALRKAVATDTTHKGRITFNANQLLVDGVPVVAGTLTRKLGQFLQQGIDLTPWLKLIENIWANPAAYARDEFLLWFEAAQMPVTPDGNFIAYKRVRSTYFDIHSNTIEYKIGTTVEMDRSKVDPDRHRTCSAGLHFCSKSYLPNFSSNGGSDRVVLVEINPADVVSIPSDYSNAKGRAWRMKVIGEVPLDSIESLSWDVVYHDDDNDTTADDAFNDGEDVDKYNINSFISGAVEDDHLVLADGAGHLLKIDIGDVIPGGHKLLYTSPHREYGLFATADGLYACGCRVLSAEDAINHCFNRVGENVDDEQEQEFYKGVAAAIMKHEAATKNYSDATIQA